jgi:RNA polymerase sigma factor (sigma-70 family)
VPALAPQREPGLIPPPEGAEDFFLASYTKVVRAVRYAGAEETEAEDAASEALAYMLRRWPVPGYPLAFACTAAVNYFIKARTRGDDRVARRLVERGHVPTQEGAEDAGLSRLEGEEWISRVLEVLTESQRDVLRCFARGLNREEIALDLGLSGGALRRRLSDARARLVDILGPDGEFIKDPTNVNGKGGADGQ